MKNRAKVIKRIIIGLFISVPLISSFISTIHLIDFFMLGNVKWIAWFLSFAFEVGAICSFLILTLFPKIKKGMVWLILLAILFPMQIVGNIYSSFSFINGELAKNPLFLKDMVELIGTLAEYSASEVKTLISIIIGVSIPAISLFLLKSTVSMIQEDTEAATVSPDELVIESVISEAPAMPPASLEADPVASVVLDKIETAIQTIESEPEQEPDLHPESVKPIEEEFPPPIDQSKNREYTIAHMNNNL
jgi:hypothetical protein